MSDAIVIDASVGMRVMIEDQEGHAESRACIQALLAAGHRLIAPEVYHYEMGNGLSRGPGDAARKARMLSAARGVVDLVPLSESAADRAMAVAAAKKLSFYDAAYLAVAEEADVSLWTEDKEILKRFPGRTASTVELMRRRSRT